jgi:hypothetical protein
MDKLVIPKKLNEEVIENFLGNLEKSSEKIDLEIPLEIEYRGFGILPILFLLFFTWVRRKEGKLVIPIENADSEILKLLNKDYFGYLFFSTIWKHCDIVTLKGESLKPILINYTRAMHDRIDFLTALPNESVMIPCFDHYSKEKGLSHWFYSDNYNFAATPSSLDNSIVRIYESLSKNFRDKLLKNSVNVIEDIQKILWELLKNTDEHATRDYLNDIILMPNSRGLFMKIQRSSKVKFIEKSNGHKGLEKFYDKSLKDGDNFILEISVFDSGPGLVRRFLGKKWTNGLSMNDEIDTIKKCLIKGQTSVISVKGKNKGFGLDDVLSLLDKKKGFLKIRTGSASVYRDLTESPYVKTNDINEIDLYDWLKLSNNDFSRMNYIEGTLITLAYPIN